MHTSRFQLGLIACSSLALGIALSSSEAVGYPASAVSLGSNPIVSSTGTMNLGGTPTDSGVISASETHDLVITDVLVGLSQISDYCDANGEVVLSDEEGTHYARIPVYMTVTNESQPAVTAYQPRSGILIPAGRSISVSWNFDFNQCSYGSYNLRYNLSGYLAQP